MTYVRVTRDQRGYETTYLFHTPHPGEQARVLYWYRTAPSIRVGRPALDEEAIRTIEEQHPDIEFDWHHLLEELATIPAEVERRPERPRRRPRPREEAEPAQESQAVEPEPATAVSVDSSDEAPAPAGSREQPAAAEPTRAGNPLLDQLVGREIATRLRTRYAEVNARLNALPDDAARRSWQARADALDPDRWSTPEAILSGVQNADRLFDELKHELP